jgi:PIN domain nuclease of toxin-antitoxin system
LSRDPAISFIEVSQKVHTGKLAFSMPVNDWFSIAIPPKRIRLIPIDPAIALEAYNLGPEFHNDPADRIITATAKVHGLRLATSDRKLLAYSGIQSLATR